MTVWDMNNAKDARDAGKALGREGLSKLVIQSVDDFDGSYKGAMRLAGQLKAISQAAKFDQYWTEKVDDGYMDMLFKMRHPK